MPLSHRDHFMRNASGQGHEHIPVSVHISQASWYEHGEGLLRIADKHPSLFAGLDRDNVVLEPPANAGPECYTDPWGCQWRADIPGLDGQVVGHPLANWDDFDSWQPPEPMAFSEAEHQRLTTVRERGDLGMTWLNGHGFFFLLLTYLRGIESFMLDVATEDPRLDKLISLIADHYEPALLKSVDVGVDLVWAADDLGTQYQSFLGPTHFRRYVLPTYQRLFLPARASGAHVFLHTDGYIMDIAEELLESGVSIPNIQDLANGIDAIAEIFKARACISLDIDRQTVTPFGSPGDCRELIKQEVMTLGSPGGGLELVYGMYPPTPLANCEAICSALEEFQTYWVGK